MKLAFIQLATAVGIHHCQHLQGSLSYFTSLLVIDLLLGPLAVSGLSQGVLHNPSEDAEEQTIRSHEEECRKEDHNGGIHREDWPGNLGCPLRQGDHLKQSEEAPLYRAKVLEVVKPVIRTTSLEEHTIAIRVHNVVPLGTLADAFVGECRARQQQEEEDDYNPCHNDCDFLEHAKHHHHFHSLPQHLPRFRKPEQAHQSKGRHRRIVQSTFQGTFNDCSDHERKVKDYHWICEDPNAMNQ
mmetsp:Transcript_60380/g.112066  ORF Transcript_60380/g.112066 Transcript_60380/m.112066 type:complete len:241 (+) Transcript_60380:931-1653(+)